jgi:stress response protein YsnF
MAVTSGQSPETYRTESRLDPAAGADPGFPTRSSLAFEGTVDRTPAGWIVRIPVRAEDVWVEKQTFVMEEVRVRRDGQMHTAQVEGQTRREELRVENVAKPGRARTARSK